MKIDISLKEYFDELKITEDLYGQEEGLYPWIFNLLLMCNNKFHFIDMHNAGNINGSADRDNSRGESGFPDFTVYDSDKKLLGCVEIKKIIKGKPLLSLNKSKCESFNFDGTKTVIYFYKLYQQHRHKDEPQKMGKRTEKQSIIITKEQYERYNEITLNKGKMYYKGNVIIDINNVVQKLLENGAEIVSDRAFETTYNTNFLKDSKHHLQIIGQLIKFKRVLFTNGLEFYFLTLKDKKIFVECIADLTKHFDNYNGETIPQEAQNIWDNLINNLSENIWCK